MPNEILEAMENNIIERFCKKLRELMSNDKIIPTDAAFKSINEAVETYERLYPKSDT